MAEPLAEIEIDTAALLSALDRLPEVMQERYLKPAAYATAQNIKREAQRRVARDTGQTFAGIGVTEDRSRDGYVVFALRDEFPNLPIWLEFGTKHMAARPFMNVSALLEESAHGRRVATAVQDAIDAMGLGD